MPFIPHTEQDIKLMLDTLGIDNIDQLFDEIPQELRINGIKGLPPALNEMEITRLMAERSSKDQAGLCFIGAGAYEHHIPAAVWEIASRGEFMTAYTPYQAEASQGTLQTIYEYQTMIANLMGMEVANASLYDGASAVAEAALMAVRVKKNRRTILIPQTLHPRYRQTTATITTPQQLNLITIPYDPKQGHTATEKLTPYKNQDIAALVINQPNFFGVLEDVDAMTTWAHQQGALVIAVVNPMSMALLKEPGSWGDSGADIVVGDGQPLGGPLASGGPYFGFMATKKDYLRTMPGRIVGRTTDSAGNEGFVLNLQAREQHIRRSKATSNICTNQGLMTTAAAIYMSLLGAEGLQKTAFLSHLNATQLQKKLKAYNLFQGEIFHEFVLHFKKPVTNILEKLAQKGIQGGYNLQQDYPELGNALLVCATETKTKDDLIYYAKKLRAII